mmetsp:Transcript_27596/g.69587  ORF Transcript_27596/g.69587 Transcript_27596/m.69587 type:complete len:169 (-) Transcript_27596:95-601(-)
MSRLMSSSGRSVCSSSSRGPSDSYAQSRAGSSVAVGAAAILRRLGIARLASSVEQQCSEIARLIAVSPVQFANLPLPPVSTVYCTATPTTVLEGVRQLVGLFIDVPVVWRPLSRTNLGLEVEHLDPGSPLVAAVLRRLQDTLGELEPGSRVVVYVVSKQVDKDLATTF